MIARLYNREEEDELEIGPRCFWREPGYVKAVDTHGKTVRPKPTLKNRTNFLAFLKAHEVTAMNTWFSKPPEKQATYREMNKAEEGKNTAPYTIKKYAVLDYLITKGKWAKSVKEIESDLQTRFDSSHFLLKTKLRFASSTDISLKVKGRKDTTSPQWMHGNNTTVLSKKL